MLLSSCPSDVTVAVDSDSAGDEEDSAKPMAVADGEPACRSACSAKGADSTPVAMMACSGKDTSRTA